MNCTTERPSAGQETKDGAKDEIRDLPSADAAHFVVRFDEATGAMIAVTRPMPEDAANRLGQRLAAQHPGIQFFVMQAVRMLRSAGVEIQELGANRRESNPHHDNLPAASGNHESSSTVLPHAVPAPAPAAQAAPGGESAHASAPDSELEDLDNSAFEAELSRFEERLARRGLLDRFRPMRNVS